MTYIYSEERFQQAALLKGSEFMGVASSDIDLVIDLGDKAVIFVELKTKGTPLRFAQKSLLTRLVKNSTIPAFLIVASHDTSPNDETCELALVEEVYWRFPDEGRGFNWLGFDTDYDGDTLSLNHMLSALTYHFSPRQLNSYHELPAPEDYDIIYSMLDGHASFGEEADKIWLRELTEVQAKIGKIKQAPTGIFHLWRPEQQAAYLEKYGVK